jgi:drug/metabolite transporter (DMT)-like permease
VGEIVKTFIVIALAALSAAVGETLLSYAMKRSGRLDLNDPSHWINLIFSVVRNPYIFVGVLFLAVFFFLYLIALSWADLSFVLPLTAVSYIFAALLARFFLGEDVSWMRWAGTVIITIGIAFVALAGKPRTAHDHPTEVHHDFPSVKSPER